MTVVSPSKSSSSSSSSKSGSGGGVQESLISSVKSVKMEKSEDSVPPVDTSFRRWYPLNENREEGSGDDGAD